ncbi:hypothetical protein BSU6633_07986 [Bacillus spizizenii ATCC 6633 = JCM 2499]|nr:hypothetical protein BSU6633_07986 [Bacillus spizizenii ATCC 6633 = JCM 2499]
MMYHSFFIYFTRSKCKKSKYDACLIGFVSKLYKKLIIRL